jgi:hypothetical protein
MQFLMLILNIMFILHQNRRLTVEMLKYSIKKTIDSCEKNLVYSSSLYIFPVTRSRAMQIQDNIHLVVNDYMSNFEHFSICNKGEKKIFLWSTKTFGLPFTHPPTSWTEVINLPWILILFTATDFLALATFVYLSYIKEKVWISKNFAACFSVCDEAQLLVFSDGIQNIIFGEFLDCFSFI